MKEGIGILIQPLGALPLEGLKMSKKRLSKNSSYTVEYRNMKLGAIVILEELSVPMFGNFDSGPLDGATPKYKKSKIIVISVHIPP